MWIIIAALYILAASIWDLYDCYRHLWKHRERKYQGKGTRYIHFSQNERGWNLLLLIKLKSNLKLHWAQECVNQIWHS